MIHLKYLINENSYENWEHRVLQQIKQVDTGRYNYIIKHLNFIKIRDYLIHSYKSNKSPIRTAVPLLTMRVV